MRWHLEATFDASDLEADGIADQLMVLLPLGAVIDFEEQIDQATEPEASLFERVDS